MQTYNKEDVKSFHEKGLMWFLFGTLISADSLIKIKDYESSIRILEKLQKSIPEANINQEDKDKYLEKVNSCLELVKKEYEIKKKRIERRKKICKETTKRN